MSADRACELCGNRQSRELYVLNGWPIVRCSNCGLIYVGREAEERDLLELYDEDYYESSEAVGYGGYGEAEDRKRHHDRTLLDQLEELVPPGDMLEIGCAYGFFLDEARKRGWRVHGVEPAEHAARHARERLGLAVAADPRELGLGPASLDAVVMWDVVEHLPAPRATVEAAYTWLRPEGVIALSTGDIGSSSARLHKDAWSLMTPPWHQFFFSRPTMRRLLVAAGFEVVSLTGDGTFAIDPGARRQRVPTAVTRWLARPEVTRIARRVGAGSIMFVFARKAAR